MIQLTAVLYRKPELTHEEFVDHWTTRHGPLMIETAGVAQYLRGYVQHVRTDDSVWSGPAGCDGVAQQWFDDLDAFQEMLADPDYAQVIAPDEERFLDRSQLRYAITSHTNVLIPPPAPEIR